mgnify:CR=1 FL=1
MTRQKRGRDKIPEKMDAKISYGKRRKESKNRRRNYMLRKLCFLMRLSEKKTQNIAQDWKDPPEATESTLAFFKHSLLPVDLS